MSLTTKIYDRFSIGFLDYPNPKDFSINIFFQGCSHKCRGCSNPEFRPLGFGTTVTVNELYSKIVSFVARNRTNKICLLGGDPLFKSSVDFTRKLLLLLNENGFEVCLYTGYSLVTVRRLEIQGFKFVKTGKYIDSELQVSEKTDDYLQFASTNQKLFDSEYNLLSKDGRYYFKN